MGHPAGLLQTAFIHRHMNTDFSRLENPAGFDVILVFFSPLLFKQWTCSHCELCSTSTFRDSPEFSSCMDTLSYCEPINSVVLALCSSAMICLQS